MPPQPNPRNLNVRSIRRRPSVARSKRPSTCDPRSPLREQASRHLLAHSPESPTPKLAKLRVAVLDHLQDLEGRLSKLQSPLRQLDEDRRTRTRSASSSSQTLQVPAQRNRSGSFSAIEDARRTISDGLEMLGRIRADVCSHLPDFSFNDMQSHISSLELPNLDLHIPSTPLSPSLDAIAFKFDKIQSPLSYLPTLTNHLESLHEHILSLRLPSSISLDFTAPSPNGRISELLFKLRDPDLFTDPLKSPLDFLGDSRKTFEFPHAESLESQAAQIEYGLVKSRYGDQLILFQDLPQRYRNDEFVLSGYRFIPLYRWPLLVLSVFQFHNETANIWTHLLPLLYSLATLSSFIPFFQSAQLPVDLAERVFTLFANICLFSSCVWHVMSGCSHRHAMETAARIDYVGIGWLISASIGSVVYYGFGCRPQTAALYLSVTFALGIAGSILPFMTWFNERKNKKWRIAFFLSLVLPLFIPLAHLAALHSLRDMYDFFRPEFPSLAAYAIGLIFYAFHFPECAVPIKWTKYTDWIGGGSHAIWHVFIILAIRLHKSAMMEYRGGIGDEVCKLY